MFPGEPRALKRGEPRSLAVLGNLLISPPTSTPWRRPLRTLSQEDLDYLNECGFDEILFESWRKSVNQGWLSEENTLIKSELLAPPQGSINNRPKRDSEEFDAEFDLGASSIASGQLGIVILNGGMATRFGGVVKGIVGMLGQGRSFLALKFEDVTDIVRVLTEPSPVVSTSKSSM